MRFGNIDVRPVLDGIASEDPRHILTRPGVDDAWTAKGEVLDDRGSLTFDIGGFLIKTADRVVVVDAGVGPVTDKVLGHGGRYTGGKFLASLRAHGIAPENVTDVLLTHLHWDHVGWTTQKGQVVFPGATYRAHRLDWEHFVDSPDASPGAVRKLTPIADRLELFDKDVTLAPGVDAVHSPGHTPGSTVFVVSGDGRRGFLLGDVVHSTVELEEPDWRAIFDEDPELASQTRNLLADELVASGDFAAGGHFPGLNFGRLVLDEGRRRFRAL